MSGMKRYLETKTEQLASDFRDHLEWKGKPASQQSLYDEAMKVIIHRCPEVDTAWDDEWQWVQGWLRLNTQV